jgi:hypothetical membrane protein
MLGSAFFLFASVAAALAYRGSMGELYSPLNHWVSELGELGVSQLAIVFNVGLIVGGACLAIFMAALGAAREGRLRWLYVPIGVVAGVAGMLVGVFPMNQIAVHRIVALTFFMLGWIAVGLASADIWRRRDPRFARWLPWLGLLTVVCFICFLVVYVPTLTYSGTDESRPALSIATILEWLVLIGVIGWVLAASATWWRALRGPR